jgi:hypothetical protein
MLLPHNHYERPSTTTGTSVGPPVAVNIDFCVLDLSEKYALQYATENLSGQELLLVSRASVDIEPTLDSSANDKQNGLCMERYYSNEIRAQLQCLDKQIRVF